MSFAIYCELIEITLIGDRNFHVKPAYYYVIRFYSFTPDNRDWFLKNFN